MAGQASTHYVQFRLPEELYEKLVKAAHKAKVPMSEYIREALKEKMERK